MKFIDSLHCEILKIKGSALLWISIGGSMVLAMVFTLRFIYLGHYLDRWEIGASWERLFLQNIRPFTGFLLPIGVILICSLITQIEYKNNNWKQLHTTPQSYTTIFFSKFVSLLVVTVIVFFFFNIAVLINGVLPNLIANTTLPRDTVPFAFFSEYTLKSFISILPIVGIQYLLSLHYKNFIVAVGAGLILYVSSMPMTRIDYSFINPYSYALHFFDLKFHNHHFTMAIAYFMILFIASYILYVTKSVKG